MLPHMVWPSANLGFMSETCCTRLAENTGCKKSPKIRHLRNIAQICRAMSSQLRHVSTSGKNLLNSNSCPTSSHNMVNFSIAAEIGSLVWGTPANFSGFLVLASLGLLQRRRSTEANQTLHDVWLFPRLVHYIFLFGGSGPVTEFCQVQSSLCIQVLHSPILAALLHGAQVVGISQTLRH